MRGSTQALHDWEQLVFNRRRKERSACSRAACGLGRSLCRLFFHSAGGDQAARIDAHNRRREDRLRHRRILKTRAAGIACESELVTCERVRGLHPRSARTCWCLARQFLLPYRSIRPWPSEIAPPSAGRLRTLGVRLRLLCILIRTLVEEQR